MFCLALKTGHRLELATFGRGRLMSRRKVKKTEWIGKDL